MDKIANIIEGVVRVGLSSFLADKLIFNVHK
jgi:hypothetical protein